MHPTVAVLFKSTAAVATMLAPKTLGRASGFLRHPAQDGWASSCCSLIGPRLGGARCIEAEEARLTVLMGPWANRVAYIVDVATRSFEPLDREFRGEISPKIHCPLIRNE